MNNSAPPLSAPRRIATQRKELNPMKTCIARLRSAAQYSQSKSYERGVPKLSDKESNNDYEERTWREKCHIDEAGQIVIPGMAFKMALDKAAQNLSMKVKEKGRSTYTKHFLSGVIVIENFPIGIKKEDVEAEWLFVNSDGIRGSGKRVWRCFPLIREWETDVTFHVADDTIGKEVFEKHLEESGKFVGIGRFRPERGGFKGRFEVVSTTWS